MRVDCTVNGEPRVADDVWEGESLLYVLRERLGLPGSKNACEQGECGSGAVQCGFCTPGLLIATHDLLRRDPNPSDARIREALAGNLCRCTGYQKILDAVHLAATRLQASASDPSDPSDPSPSGPAPSGGRPAPCRPAPALPPGTLEDRP